MYWSVVWCSGGCSWKCYKNPHVCSLLTRCTILAPAMRSDIWTSKSGPNPECFVHVDFEMCFAPQWRALFRHRNFQKWSEHGVFFTCWLEMCFAPQRRALFLHLNFKSGPSMVCFVYFDFEMCFTPQRRALFRHRNFQKWSEHGVFCTFWLGNVLRATTACNFSSLVWPDGSHPPL